MSFAVFVSRWIDGSSGSLGSLISARSIQNSSDGETRRLCRLLPTILGRVYRIKCCEPRIIYLFYVHVRALTRAWCDTLSSRDAGDESAAFPPCINTRLVRVLYVRAHVFARTYTHTRGGVEREAATRVPHTSMNDVASRKSKGARFS